MNLVRIQVQGPVTRWHYVIAESRSAQWKAELEAKWPDVTVTVEPYRQNENGNANGNAIYALAVSAELEHGMREPAKEKPRKRRTKENSDRPKGGVCPPGARSADLRGSPVAGLPLADKPAKRGRAASIFASPVGAKGWQQLCLPIVADERKRKKK